MNILRKYQFWNIVIGLLICLMVVQDIIAPGLSEFSGAKRAGIIGLALGLLALAGWGVYTRDKKPSSFVPAMWGIACIITAGGKAIESEWITVLFIPFSAAIIYLIFSNERFDNLLQYPTEGREEKSSA